MTRKQFKAEKRLKTVDTLLVGFRIGLIDRSTDFGRKYEQELKEERNSLIKIVYGEI